MVTLDERLWSLLLGVAIGYGIRVLQDRLMRNRPKQDHRHDEGGFMRFPIVADVALLLVVAVTVWAAFASARASNALEITQARIEQVTKCNQRYLDQTITALNERTEFTRGQISANVDLQKDQLGFLEVVLKQPPATDSDRRIALEFYSQEVDKFITLNEDAVDDLRETPYPKTAAMDACLGSAKEALDD